MERKRISLEMSKNKHFFMVEYYQNNNKKKYKQA